MHLKQDLYEGKETDTSNIRSYDDLPANKRKIFEFIEKHTRAKIRIISVGPERKQTIIR